MSWLRVTCIAMLLLPIGSAARADFRVFEENAPGERDEPEHEDEGDAEDEAPPAAPAPAAPSPAAPPAAPAPAPAAPSPAAPTAPQLTEPSSGAAPSEAPGETSEPAPEGASEVAEPPRTAGETSADVAAAAEVPAPEAPPAEEEDPDLLEQLLDDHRWLDLTGFVQPGFIVRLDSAADGISAGVTDDTFWLQRARAGLRAQVFEWLRLRLEIEFAPVTLLQDAFVEILLHPFINVRVGQMIVPFLATFRFNELNIAFLDRAIYTPQRPDREFIRYLSPRDVGIQLYGRIGDADPAHHDPVFDYGLGLFIGRGPNIALNDDGVFLWAARLQLHLFGLPEGVDRENDLDRNDHFRTSVAFGAYSNCDDRANWNRGFTIDLESRFEGFYASGAFVWMRNGAGGEALLSDSDDCRGQSITNPDGSTATLEYVSRGAHLQAQYALPPLLADVFGAPFDAMTIELLARVDWVDGFSPFIASDPLFGGGPSSPGYIAPSNYTDSDNPPTRWRLTFGLNYYPTGQNQLRIGLNYQLNREAEDVVTGSNTFVGVSNDVFWIQITAGL